MTKIIAFLRGFPELVLVLIKTIRALKSLYKLIKKNRFEQSEEGVSEDLSEVLEKTAKMTDRDKKLRTIQALNEALK